MKERFRPIKEERNLSLKIGNDYIIITAVKLPEKGISKVEIKKGEEIVMSIGIKVNIEALQKLKNEIGVSKLQELFNLAFTEIEPELKENLLKTVLETQKLLPKIQKSVETNEGVIIDLKELWSKVDERIEEALQSPLNEQSKEAIKELKEKLEKIYQPVRLDERNLRVFKQMVEIIEKVARLEGDENFLREKNKAIKRIQEGKKEEAVAILMGFILNSFRNKGLRLDAGKLFQEVIYPFAAINAGFAVETLDKSLKGQQSKDE